MARLKMFAALREAAGRSEDHLSVPDVASLLAECRARYGPEFGRRLDFANVAVNGILISSLQGEATPLGDDDEVALLPPVSGGSSAQG